MALRMSRQTVQIAITMFFLNRAFTFEFISISHTVSEIYILISEFLTVYEVFFFFFARVKKGRFNISYNAIFILISMYYLYLLLNSILQGTNIRRVFMAAYPVLGTVAFLYNNSSKNYKCLIDGVALYFKFTIIATFLDAVFLRHIMTDSVNIFLIGGKNQIAITLVMALSFIALDYDKSNDDNAKNKKTWYVRTIMYLFLILFLGFNSGSSTVIVCVTVMFILFILSKKNIYISSKLFFTIYSIAWVSIIVFRLHYIIANFLLNVLHKDLTLSHRTMIWDAALDLIKEKPIFGYGNPDTYNVFSVNHDFTGGHNDVWTTLSGHNQILQILYYGGIVMLFILIWIYFISTKQSNNNHSSYMFFISVIVISLTWMSEVPGEYGMFLALTMCFLSQTNHIKETRRG